jgi:peptidoglycan hydrolase-like protein with peptidoglycan-binding domain
MKPRRFALRAQGRLAGVISVVLALCLPATSLAADGKESRSGHGHARQAAEQRAGQVRADGATRRPTQLLSRGAGYGTNGGSKPVRVLQRRLRGLGHSPGPIDGLYGPLTEAAVRSFQRSQGLAVDGIAGPRTWKAVRSPTHLLSRGAGYGTNGGSKPVRVLQRRLRGLGHSPGPIDGRYGPLTEAAVRSFQQARGLVVDGSAGPRTERRLQSLVRFERPDRSLRPLRSLRALERRPPAGPPTSGGERSGAPTRKPPVSLREVARRPDSGAHPARAVLLALGMAALLALLAAAGTLVARARRRPGGVTWYPRRRRPKPLLFLDVDGVVALNMPGDEAPPGRRYLLGLGYVYVPDACREHVRRLEERFELVWATGWEKSANRELPELLGLSGPLPALSFGRRADSRSSQWKIRQVARYARGRPAVWIDDHIDERHQWWARRRRAPTLLIKADPNVGVTGEEVDRLLDWARDLVGERLEQPPVPAPTGFRRAAQARAPGRRTRREGAPGGHRRRARRGPPGPGHR